MEWIKVKDRLPKESQRLLIFNSRGEIEFGRAYICPEYGNIFWEKPNGEDYVWIVTHWMPLPSPPTEQEKSE